MYTFPLLGAGTAKISALPEAPNVSILELQAILFAALCGSFVLVLRIIQELWQPSKGAFGVDNVLQEMLFGLEKELAQRIDSVVVGSAEDAEKRE